MPTPDEMVVAPAHTFNFLSAHVLNNWQVMRADSLLKLFPNLHAQPLPLSPGSIPWPKLSGNHVMQGFFAGDCYVLIQEWIVVTHMSHVTNWVLDDHHAYRYGHRISPSRKYRSVIWRGCDPYGLTCTTTREESKTRTTR